MSKDPIGPSNHVFDQPLLMSTFHVQGQHIAAMEANRDFNMRPKPD